MQPVDPETSDYILSLEDLEVFRSITLLIRAKLLSEHPAFIRRAAVVLIALERLPKITPGVNITVGWQTKSVNGNYIWADISVSEEGIRAVIGGHSYDSDVGGDTQSETVFVSTPNSYRRGNLEMWSERAQSVAEVGYLVLRDEWAGEDHIDWNDYDN